MRSASGIFLFVLFPGYFFYHIAYSFGMVPYIGIFTITLAIACGYFLIKLFIGLLRNPYPIVPFADACFVLLIITLSAITIVNHTLNDGAYIDTDGLVFSASIIVSMTGFYFLGRNIVLEQQKKSTLAALALLAGYLACAIIFYQENGGYMLLPTPSESAPEPSNYQGLARSVMYSLIFTLPFIKSGLMRFVYAAASLACLYLIGSRTDFALCAMVFLVSMLIRSSIRGAVMAYGLMIFALPAALYFLYQSDRFAISSTDPSLVARGIFTESSIDGISGSPILGDYLGQVRDFGDIGSYAHNALSMYQQFGAAPFIAYIAFIIFSLLIAIKSLAINRRSPYTELLLHLSVVALAGVLVAKSILWTTPVLAWGLAVSIRRDRYACIRP